MNQRISGVSRGCFYPTYGVIANSADMDSLLVFFTAEHTEIAEFFFLVSPCYLRSLWWKCNELTQTGLALCQQSFQR
jgi:hypothetical protein